MGPEPRPGLEVVVDVRALASGGAGVADLPGGRVVFVHRTAPGDRVRIRLTRVKSRWARGELVEVVEPSPARRDAPCPHYARCGGCTLEHLRYPDQLRWKGRMVRDALERIGGAEVDVPDVLPSPSEFRYRSRVSFHLRRLPGRRVVAGFHELERPGRILDMDGACLLPEEEIATVWDGIRGAWGPGAGRLPPGDALRLTLRSVVGGVVLLVEPEDLPGGRRGGAGGDEALRRDAAALVDGVDGLRSLWWRPAGSEPALLAGDPDTEEAFMDRRVKLGPGAFLQVNRRAAEQLHEAVAVELGPPEGLRFVDAYCGVGAYGRHLARGGGKAVGIELDAEAARAARADAPDGFTVLHGTVEERLEEALPADTVVANPPRGGLHGDVAALLRGSGVGRLVYVSCDPATLARDVARLDGAFRVVRLRAFDLFPQTAHVETVAVLERRA